MRGWGGLVVVVCLASCGARTGLEVPTASRDAGVDAPRDVGLDAPDVCVPTAEICNRADDDCDGAIDDGVRCFTLDGAPLEALPATSCGASWYAYDAPDTQSANPSPDLRASQRVAVALTDAPCGVGLAVIADLPRDESGGSLLGAFTIDPPSAGGIAVGDEPGECSYDPSTGGGRCTWTWQPCCTDGVMLGTFTTDFCVSLVLSAPTGVSDVVVFDGADRTIARAFEAVMTLCGTLVPAVP